MKSPTMHGAHDQRQANMKNSRVSTATKSRNRDSQTLRADSPPPRNASHPSAIAVPIGKCTQALTASFVKPEPKQTCYPKPESSSGTREFSARATCTAEQGQKTEESACTLKRLFVRPLHLHKKRSSKHTAEGGLKRGNKEAARLLWRHASWWVQKV